MPAPSDQAADSLQQAVDLLEAILGRPVILEDAEMRPLAYSRQPDDIDAARRNVILHRGVEPGFLQDYRALGIDVAKGPVWTPALPQWEAEPRLCVPVRKGRTLVAYLWVLAAEGTLTPDQVDAASRSATYIGSAFDAQRAARRSAEHASAQAVAALLGQQADVADVVAAVTTTAGVAADSNAVVVAVDMAFSTEPDTDVADLALRVRDRLPVVGIPVRWLVHMGARPAVIAVADSGVPIDEVAVAAAVLEAVRAGVDKNAVVGTGGAAVPLTGVRQATERAMVAAWVARNTGQACVLWGDTGAWRLVARLTGTAPGERDLKSDIHPGLLDLIAADRDDLVTTLDTYLRTGGDARATADLLHMHRSSLYYRLDRIAEATGTDLHDGEARFELALGLKVAALLGLLPATNAGSRTATSDT